MLPGKAAMAVLLALYGNSGLDTGQLYCLAQNVWFEAEHSDPVDRRAVAHATLNRVQDKRFPGDVCSVVWQKGQFSWTRDGKSDTVLVTVRQDYVDAWVSVLAVAADALSGRSSDETGGATFYHATYVLPAWAGEMRPTLRTTGHIYYRRD